MNYLIAIIIGYLLGSIPFGLIITRMAGLGDIRSIGSGNIGATNVLRTGRKDIAIATLLLDAGKAMFALFIMRHFFGNEIGWIAGAAAFLGHCFPVWLKFKGGKGVATFFGTLFIGYWPLGIVSGLVWLSAAFISKYSSLGALIAAIIAPIASVILKQNIIVTLAISFMSILIFIRHKDNIKKLLNGTESKIGNKSKPELEANNT